jgi:CTP:molybdopterin cytidylyltransferase MocA
VSGPGAVILAAGAGRRLGGTNKALLRDAGGRSYLEAVWRSAQGAGANEAVVVVGAPHRAETEAEAARLSLPVAVNPAPARGMASSVAVGFAHAVRAFGGRRALLWPVDHPAVRPATVRALLAAAGAIAVPTYGGRGGHPSCFDRAVWPELAACADAADGARTVVRADPDRVCRIEVDDAGVIRDVDTRADLG